MDIQQKQFLDKAYIQADREVDYMVYDIHNVVEPKPEYDFSSWILGKTE